MDSSTGAKLKESEVPVTVSDMRHTTEISAPMTSTESKEPKSSGSWHRKVSVPLTATEHKESIRELKRKQKRKLSLPNKPFNPIKDPTKIAHDSFAKKRGCTGVSWDDEQHDHFCPWDENYPENPQRFKSIFTRCNELGLIERCQHLLCREATKEELQLIHSENMVHLLESLTSVNEEKLKEISSNYDSIYINNNTYDVARRAVGCTIEATEAVMEGNVQNAMVLVRPPGHHAMENDFCGYSFFNNVAIAAKYAIQKNVIGRVMIVDWDVHHGQGTQQAFYDEERVLYFSIHRYQYGSFWPNLREGDSDYIGENDGKGFNINVPINDIEMHNEDYLYIFHNLLMPIAYEYNPDLILISAGYDAALGCPEGKMNLTPAIFAHMTHSLMSLAEGKVVAVLEGGYFLETLAESAALTLRTLLGDPCPRLLESLSSPHYRTKETVLDVMAAHRLNWDCFRSTNPLNFSLRRNFIKHPSLDHAAKTENSKFDIMGGYPVTPKEDIEQFLREYERLKSGTSLIVPKNRVCLAYDKLMEDHENETRYSFPEKKERTIEIMKRLEEAEIMNRVHVLKARQATPKQLKRVHCEAWVTTFLNIKNMTPQNRSELEDKYNSIYVNKSSTDSALCAAGCMLQVVDSVCTGESRSGIAVIRPPGHHAEIYRPEGFCLINNVAVGTAHALREHNLKRVLILDWDIHHGNGIQNIFEDNPKVLYISIHAYCNGEFFPGTSSGNHSYVGKKSGRGFNVNIPWSTTGMKDGDYLAAFFRIVLPIAYQFDPQLVMVSAGFDAAVNDPLGKCYLSPECFGHMTHLLMSLSSGKIILALEGGYNLETTSYSMAMCAKALLGDPLPKMAKFHFNNRTNEIIDEVLIVQSEFWKLLYDENEVLSQILEKINLYDTATGSEIAPEVWNEKCAASKTDKRLSSQDINFEKLSSEFNRIKLADVEEKKTEGAVGGNDASFLKIDNYLGPQKVFAVTPKTWCPHVELVTPVPTVGLNVNAECELCSDLTENWICLICYQVHCSRHVNGDMLRHKKSTDHQIVMSCSDISVWCYKCNSYIDNDLLEDAISAARKSKFDEK